MSASAMLTRDDFDIPDDVIYLNAAGNGPLPHKVAEAAKASIELKRRCWSPMPESDHRIAVAESFGKIVGCDVEQVAFMPSTTFAISLAAANAASTLTPGTHVLVVMGQFSSNVLPWQSACEKTGAALMVVPTPDDGDWTKAILAHLDDTVRIVALPPCHWHNGNPIDLEKIGNACNTIVPRPLFVVDATQAAGAMPIDVARMKIDYLAASVHKWMLGCYGASLVYVSKPLSSTWTPLDHHDRHRLGADDPAWDAVCPMTFDGYPTAFQVGACRLSGGGHLNPVVTASLAASLPLLLNAGIENVFMCLRGWCQLIAQEAHKIGWRTPTSATPLESSPLWQSHFIGIAPPETSGVDVAVVVNGLKEQYNCHVSARGGYIRVSPHVWTTENDVKGFIQAIVKLTT